MPAILSSLFAALGGSAVKIGLALLLAAALLGCGFVWGDMHATRAALDAAAKDGDARVAALQKNYQAVTRDYLGKLSAANARGDGLAASLAAANGQLAANTDKAKEAITHAMPPNPSCDLPAAAVGVLRAHPARH
jgi:hypothetical protein